MEGETNLEDNTEGGLKECSCESDEIIAVAGMINNIVVSRAAKVKGELGKDIQTHFM